MESCPIHLFDLPCRMCEAEAAKGGTVITRYYLEFGRVVMDILGDKITSVRSCQFGDQRDLIGHSPRDFTSAW